jgi:site-specific recombinase XerD
VRDWTKAQQILREWEERGERPKAMVPKATIEHLQEQFLKNMETENRTSETIRKYRLLFKLLVAFTQEKGIRFVCELDLSVLEEFRASWKDNNLSKQKKQERLRTVFRYARKHRMIDDNPSLDLGKIKVDPTQVVPFTDDELNRIFKAAKADNPRIYALALLMRYSGLRISDATMLRLDQLKGDRLSLRTQKVKKDVSVLLPKPVAKALRAIEPASPNYFFWNESSKLHSLTDLYRDHYFRRVFKAAQIKSEPHPHQFRHSFAIKLLSAGVSLDNVAMLLGNTPKIVWKHYAAWVPERQQALDEAVTKANSYHHLDEEAIPARAVQIGKPA